MDKMTQIPLNLYMTYIIRGYDKFIKRKIDENEINPGDIPFLIGIYHNEGASQNEISASYRETEAYITKVLNKLQKNDLIKKEYSPEKKTRKLIYLTNKGKNVSEKAIKCINEWEEYITSDLNPEEKEKFEESFEKIAQKSMNIGFI